ncbi:translation initiation factor Sui1 [Myxococcota bacterium]|nr:translation initiation factor Sui1 [Myxococcota bacterium]MCZ7619002.1 translation initiation factor Sui1 [Myxococcota bacterium]
MKSKHDDRGALVYSSEHGRMCPACRRPASRCTCRDPDRSPVLSKSAGKPVVRIGRETKGRKGKGVTVVSGIPLSGGALEELASQLKRSCGSGGTVKDGVLEIQGDHRDTLVVALEQHGWIVKRSGG